MSPIRSSGFGLSPSFSATATTLPPTLLKNPPALVPINAKQDSIPCSNGFVNTMTQKPNVEQLIPLAPEEQDESNPSQWDYIYEPEAKELLDGLLTRYIESLVYQAVIENNACEQAAKMIAMKSATDNAGDLIKELELLYNNVRQAAITQELSEIVGGAAAV